MHTTFDSSKLSKFDLAFVDLASRSFPDPPSTFFSHLLGLVHLLPVCKGVVRV